MSHSNDRSAAHTIAAEATSALAGFGAADYELDLTTNQIRASSYLKALYGYPPDQQLTLNDVRIRLHPDDAPAVAARIAAMLAAGERRFQAEARIYAPDGTVNWAFVRGELTYDAAGRPLAVRGVVFDLTERKRSEQHLRFLSELDTDAAAYTGVQPLMERLGPQIAGYLQLSHCCFSFVEPAVDRITALYDWHRGDLPSVLGEHQISTFLTPEGQAAYLAGELAVVDDIRANRFLAASPELLTTLGIAAIVDVPYLVDGVWRFLLTASRAAPGAWRADEVELLRELAARVYARLERARAEAAMKRNEARLKLALSVADVALGDVDYTTDTIRLASEAAVLYGLPPAETTLSRAQLHALLHPDDRADVLRRIEAAIQPGSDGLFACEHRVVWPDRQVRWLNVRKQVFFSAAAAPPHPTHAIVVVQDITSRKRRELNAAFLAELQEVLARPLAAEAIMEGVGARLNAHLGLTRCTFAELTYQQHEVIPTYHRRIPPVAGLETPIPWSELLTATEIQHVLAGQPLLIADLAVGERSAAARALFAAMELRAMLVVPYRAEGGRWFGISAHRSHPYAWQADERELLEAIVARVFPRIEQVRIEAALRASEERLRSVFESIDEGFCIAELIFDAQNRPIDYRFIQVNPLFEELTGLQGALGRTARELVPDLEDWWFEAYGRVALTGEAVRFEHGSVAMGRVFDVYASRIGGPESRQVAIVFTNITARRAAEEQARAALAAEQAARRAAEQAFARTNRLQAFTAALAGSLTRSAVTQVITDHVLDATAAVLAVLALLDPTGERLDIAGWVGSSADNVQLQPSVALHKTTPATAAVHSGEPIWIGSRAAGEAHFPGFATLMERAGDAAYVALPLPASDRILGVLSLGFAETREFTSDERAFLTLLAHQCGQALEQAQLYADLLVSQERLQQLSHRLIDAQEQERRHLARELHDEVGQSLTGLRLVLELANRLPPDDRTLQLAEAHRLTQELIGRIRAISLDLRPAMLDDMGLLPALIWQFKRYHEQSGITVELRHWGLERRLPLAIETVAYRVIQEALTNIARHAGVATATVTILASTTQLLVQIRDGGCGFVLHEALARGTSSGLTGMQERVALLSGTLSIETAPGWGTAITADLPLQEEPAV